MRLQLLQAITILRTGICLSVLNCENIPSGQYDFDFVETGSAKYYRIYVESEILECDPKTFVTCFRIINQTIFDL